jgi:hypothetical protein
MDREYARKLEHSRRPLTDDEKLNLLNDEVRLLNGLGQMDSRFKEMLKDKYVKLNLALKIYGLSPEERLIFDELGSEYQLYEVLAPELKPVRKPVVTSTGKGKSRICKKCGLKRM